MDFHSIYDLVETIDLDNMTNFDDLVIGNLPTGNHNIAIYLTLIILKLVPFRKAADINQILIGSCPNGMKHIGYLGYKCYLIALNHLGVELDCTISIKELVGNKVVLTKLESIYNISQTYLIKPLIQQILEFGDLETKLYQSKINKILNLNILDSIEQGKNQDWITKELLERMIGQDLIKYERNGNKKYIHTISNKHYISPTFLTPRSKFSKLHELTLKTLIKYLTNNDLGHCVVLNESKGPLVTNRNSRFDIYVPEIGLLIEADGKQHFQIVPMFGGVMGFETRRNHDLIKNQFAIEDGLVLLRIAYNTTENTIYDLIEDVVANINNGKTGQIYFSDRALYLPMV
jgi:hypothetical protein